MRNLIPFLKIAKLNKFLVVAQLSLHSLKIEQLTNALRERFKTFLKQAMDLHGYSKVRRAMLSNFTSYLLFY